MRQTRHAITLTEVVLSIPLIGLVMVGAMTSTGAVLRTWNDARDNQQALSLAQQLMAEVLQQPYADPEGGSGIGSDTGEGGGTRSKWDDVDDYHGWSRTPPQAKDNVVLTGYTGWTRAVSVRYASLANPAQNSGSDEGLKRIVVTVTDPAGAATTLTAYRSRGGAMEQPPAVDATVEGYLSHELQLGTERLYNGAALPNAAE
ncbi:MAG: type II secretion system protein [Planctomycetales bacterium]|nr:type II secretion system protein [Planctomycetales bacterium]